MAKYRCIVCGNDRGLSIDSFFYGGELISTEQWCNQCNEYTEWDTDVPEFGELFASVRDKVSVKEKAENYPGRINEIIQRNDEGSISDYIEIIRVGGMDHNPKYRVELNYINTLGVGEGYFTKKDAVHVAAIDWWMKKFNTKEIPPKNGKSPSFKEQLQYLKEIGIITHFLSQDKLNLVPEAYKWVLKGVDKDRIKSLFD